MSDKLNAALDKLAGEGYKTDSGHTLTNDRTFHELKQEATRIAERDKLLKANPAISTDGLPPHLRNN